jgi:hypothetical protein
VASDDDQLGKLQRNFIEIRNRASRFRGTHGASVADLQAEGDPELDALRIERIEATIVRR